MPVNEFIAVAKGRNSFVRQCRQRRVKPAHNGVNGCIRRRGDLALCGDFCDLTIKCRDGGARLAQRQPFNQRRQIRRQLASPCVAAGGTNKSHQTLGAIEFQPTARRAEGNVAITGGAGKRNVLFEVALKDGEPDHGLLSLAIRQTGERHGLCRFLDDPVPSKGRWTVRNFVRKGTVQRTVEPTGARQSNRRYNRLNEMVR